MKQNRELSSYHKQKSASNQEDLCAEIHFKQKKKEAKKSFVAEFQSLIFKAHDSDSMKNAPVEEMRISR